MAMISYALLICLLLALVKAFRKVEKNPPENKMMHEESAGHFVAHKPQKNPASQMDVKKRATNAALINKWIHQMNASSSRATITHWNFKDDSHDTIYFTFADGIRREGKVSFIYDPALPRVSQLAYQADDGSGKRLRGYISPSFTEQQLYLNYMKEKASNEKRSYLGNIAYLAHNKGAADLNILSYQQITEEEFHGMFGKKEIKAFMKMLSEDFEKVETTDIPYILKVTAYSEPI